MKTFFAVSLSVVLILAVGFIAIGAAQVFLPHPAWKLADAKMKELGLSDWSRDRVMTLTPTDFQVIYRHDKQGLYVLISKGRVWYVSNHPEPTLCVTVTPSR